MPWRYIDEFTTLGGFEIDKFHPPTPFPLPACAHSQPPRSDSLPPCRQCADEREAGAVPRRRASKSQPYTNMPHILPKLSFPSGGFDRALGRRMMPVGGSVDARTRRQRGIGKSIVARLHPRGGRTLDGCEHHILVCAYRHTHVVAPSPARSPMRVWICRVKRVRPILAQPKFEV